MLMRLLCSRLFITSSSRAAGEPETSFVIHFYPLWATRSHSQSLSSHSHHFKGIQPSVSKYFQWKKMNFFHKPKLSGVLNTLTIPSRIDSFRVKNSPKFAYTRGYSEFEQKSLGSVGYRDCPARGGGRAGGLFPLHPIGVLRGWLVASSPRKLLIVTDGGKW